MKSQTSLEMCCAGSKSRSLGQMLEKPCVRFRGHIFRQIIMKLGQNFDFGEISNLQSDTDETWSDYLTR